MEEKAVQNVQPLRSVQAVQTPTCVLPRGAGEEGIGRSKPHRLNEASAVERSAAWLNETE